MGGLQKRLSLSNIQLAGVVVGSFIFCLLIGITVTVSLVLWVNHIKRAKHRRGRRVRLPRGPFSRHNHQVYDKPSPCSGLERFKQFEFPRDRLELLEVLGKYYCCCLTLFQTKLNHPCFIKLILLYPSFQ